MEGRCYLPPETLCVRSRGPGKCICGPGRGTAAAGSEGGGRPVAGQPVRGGPPGRTALGREMATSTIPLARGLPMVGSVFDMARDMRAFLTAGYLEHGPVFGIRLLNRRFTVLAGVEANRFLSRQGAGHFRSFEFWSGFNAWFGAARSTLSTDGAGACGVPTHAEAGLFTRICRGAHGRPDRHRAAGDRGLAARAVDARSVGAAADRHRPGGHACRRRLAPPLQRRPGLLCPRTAVGHHRPQAAPGAGRPASVARLPVWTSSTTR